MILATLSSILWTLFSLLAGMFAILLIRRITALQTRAIERLQRPPDHPLVLSS
ncbi:MAG: hypothetical protein RMM58_01415 [Chloroflexota bacterium]|nr:hypothetical protein [Dehalococcoidia bacterium]MDW8252518.1 hypothetical protein [Chloroflexota bacterium]